MVSHIPILKTLLRPVRFKRKSVESLLGVDIGVSTIKVMELEGDGEKRRLRAMGCEPTPPNAITNNTIVDEEAVSEAIKAVVEKSGIAAKKAAFSIPGPSVFSKRIHVGARNRRELDENILFEAANYIPHTIDAVDLDYQVLRAVPGGVEVLLVAVKNEIVASYLRTLKKAGLEPVIADIDYFALENMFAANYPEEIAKTVALIDVGARSSSISIVQGGLSLFAGDVNVGGRLYTDALCDRCSLTPERAEAIKCGRADAEALLQAGPVLATTTEFLLSELHRQLGFFWSAAGTEKPIEEIFLCGGASQSQGLQAGLAARTGLRCRSLECLRSVEEDSCQGVEPTLLPSLAISMGLASRRIGDKRHGVEWANDPH